MALEVGSRLGHYDVTALIGEGGMGQVYQATDTQLNRDALKKQRSHVESAQRTFDVRLPRRSVTTGLARACGNCCVSSASLQSNGLHRGS